MNVSTLRLRVRCLLEIFLSVHSAQWVPYFFTKWSIKNRIDNVVFVVSFRGIVVRVWGIFKAKLSSGFTLLMLVFLVDGTVLAGFDLAVELLQKFEAHYGALATSRVKQWQLTMKQIDHLSDIEKLKSVNDFFNQSVEFVDDIILWHVKDYWATPLEFLGKGAGDCEDYAIAKYFSLKELGVSEEKMRITYVKAIELNKAHMVLTYFETPKAVPLVLDNLVSEIKPATERGDLLPVYSFNGSGLWLAKARGSGLRVGNSDRLSLWQNLIQRMSNNDMQ